MVRYFLTGVTTPTGVWCNKSATSRTRRLKMQETSRARSSRVLRRRSVAPRLHFRCLPTLLQLLGLMSRLSRFGQTRATVWKTVSLFHFHFCHFGDGRGKLPLKETRVPTENLSQIFKLLRKSNCHLSLTLNFILNPTT